MAPREYRIFTGALQLLLFATTATGQTPAPPISPPPIAPPPITPSAPTPTSPRTLALTSAELGCVSSWEGPLEERFESSFGGWFQGANDDLDWARHSGMTPSSGTGPVNAYEGQFYAYVEGSWPNYPSKRAYLNSPCFYLENATTAEFSFAYHMFGFDVGTMALEASKDEGLTWTSLWEESGSQGTAWHTATIDLSSYTVHVLRLRFNYVTGTSFTSDAAVDFLRLSINGLHATSATPLAPTPAPATSAPPTSAPPTSAPLTSAPATPSPLDWRPETLAPPPEPGCRSTWTGHYEESFESSFGGWSQDTYNAWTRSLVYSWSGPKDVYEGQYYVSPQPYKINVQYGRAYLNSPCFDMQTATTAEFSFAYHMNGRIVGTMTLEASKDEGLTWATLWSKNGSQGTAWQTATIDLSSYTGFVLQLRFNYKSDAASRPGLDFVKLSIDGSTSAPPTSAPATLAPPTYAPTPAPPTSAPPTSAPPTLVPPTFAPTPAPATSAPPTSAPPTVAPPTFAPTPAPATSVPPTSVPPTSAPATLVPPTFAPTRAPATSVPPTFAPLTSTPPTFAPPTYVPPTSAPATPSPLDWRPETLAPRTSVPPTSAPATPSPLD